MARLFIILVIVFVAVLLWRSLHSDIKARKRKKPPSALELIRCDYCGLHIQENKALKVCGRRYCSEEHMRVDNSH
jgi:uncharacterized protein